MYSVSDLKKTIELKNINDKLTYIYGNDEKCIEEFYHRLENIFFHIEKMDNREEFYVFSASGRTELSGNHTDHNNGCVLVASINLDKLAIVTKRDDDKIVVYTNRENTPDVVSINDLEIRKSDFGMSSSLIRGVCAGILHKGYKIGGCTISLSNKVLIGSGLSASASFEALVCQILNTLYNDNKIPKVEIAMIGQYAENEYFGKRCGLMDQMGCSIGGVIAIDFENNNDPKMDKIEYSFENSGYSLMIVDAKGDHSSINDEYSSIRMEMNNVANFFNQDVCRNISLEDLISNASKIREKCGDRAFMRAYHFITENNRVSKQIEALKNNNIQEYIKLMNESGNSSFTYLQNCYSIRSIKNMGVALGLCLTKDFLGNDGACRVHGGGFAGTIQALVPINRVEEYTKYIESIFGQNSAIKVSIRQSPVCEI